MVKIRNFTINKSLLIFAVFLFLIFSNNIKAQISTTVVQNINFGTFYPGLSGGTIYMPSSSTVSRQATGSVVLINDASNAPSVLHLYLTVSKGNTSVYNGYTIPVTIVLTGSKGGSMTMTLNSLPTSFNVQKNSPQTFYIGGTLNVGTLSSNPSGTYSGSFTVRFDNY